MPKLDFKCMIRTRLQILVTCEEFEFTCHRTDYMCCSFDVFRISGIQSGFFCNIRIDTGALTWSVCDMVLCHVGDTGVLRAD